MGFNEIDRLSITVIAGVEYKNGKQTQLECPQRRLKKKKRVAKQTGKQNTRKKKRELGFNLGASKEELTCR